MQTGCKMKIEEKLQTEGIMQTANYLLFKYTTCYFHYRALTKNRTIQANCSEILHCAGSLNITQVNYCPAESEVAPVCMLPSVCISPGLGPVSRSSR